MLVEGMPHWQRCEVCSNATYAVRCAVMPHWPYCEMCTTVPLRHYCPPLRHYCPPEASSSRSTVTFLEKFGCPIWPAVAPLNPAVAPLYPAVAPLYPAVAPPSHSQPILPVTTCTCTATHLNVLPSSQLSYCPSANAAMSPPNWLRISWRVLRREEACRLAYLIWLYWIQRVVRPSRPSALGSLLTLERCMLWETCDVRFAYGKPVTYVLLMHAAAIPPTASSQNACQADLLHL